MKGLKINLHITERCNYHCEYCFAHFGKRADLTFEKWKRIIDNIKSAGTVSAINFAGGEPMLHKDFPALVDYAKVAGFGVSLISNGSLLLNEKLMPPKIFEQLDTLGISVDSFDENILRQLGCCTVKAKILSKEDFIRIVNKARSINPKIKVKINTVVSKLNLYERLTGIEEQVAIDRWKFLKVKPFENKTFSNKTLVISEDEFKYFLDRNRLTKGETVPEHEITRSYIMVDNAGNLLDDDGDDYTVVGNLMEEPFAEVFKRYHFDAELYQSRYRLSA